MTVDESVDVFEELYREMSEVEERPLIGFLLSLQYMIEKGGELYEQG